MRVQLQSPDLHHLTVLHLLLQECRVARVAAKVGQLQPTLSGILRRLGPYWTIKFWCAAGRRWCPPNALSQCVSR